MNATRLNDGNVSIGQKIMENSNWTLIIAVEIVKAIFNLKLD